MDLLRYFKWKLRDGGLPIIPFSHHLAMYPYSITDHPVCKPPCKLQNPGFLSCDHPAKRHNQALVAKCWGKWKWFLRRCLSPNAMGNTQHVSNYAILFCWSRSLTAFIISVAQDKGRLIMQQYMHSNFQFDKIFMLKYFVGDKN